MKKTWDIPHLEILDVQETKGVKGVICTYPPLKCKDIGGDGGGNQYDS